MPQVYCKKEGCGKIPSFGIVYKRPLFCKKHKEPNMVDVKHDRCGVDGCLFSVTFGYETNRPLRCVKHKANDMIDVKHPRCITKDCKERPIYGYKQGKPLKCRIHKDDDMYDVNCKKCNTKGCKFQPYFGFEKGKPTKCVTHKLDGMSNVVSKFCKLCPTVATSKYEDYCLRCFIYTFPDKPVTRNYKVKEKHMTDFIQSQYPDEIMTFDKRVEGGCSKRRPDCLIEKFSHSVIVECDENQHTVYDSTCEIARLNEIYTDLGDRPIVLIRFNPDDYINKNGTKKASSFKYLKRGIPQINNLEEWQKRLKSLKETIDFHIINVPDEQVTTINLYYDGY